MNHFLPESSLMNSVLIRKNSTSIYIRRNKVLYFLREPLIYLNLDKPRVMEYCISKTGKHLKTYDHDQKNAYWPTTPAMLGSSTQVFQWNTNFLIVMDFFLDASFFPASMHSLVLGVKNLFS